METLPSARDYQEAGFRAEQAEILGRSMTQIDAIHSKVFDELAQLRMFVEDNMPTRKEIARLVAKDDLRDMLKGFVTKDDVKNFATKDEIRDMLKNFVTKGDVKNFVTKDDIKDFMTKDDIKDFATKDDIKGFVTSSQMALEFKQLYRLLFVGMMGICGLILALVPIMLALHLAG